MSYEPKPLQRLQLWWLAVHGGEGWQKDLKPGFKNSADRKHLVEAGLIEVEKPKGNAIYLKLADKGWNYLGEHMAAELSKTRNATPILEQLLGHLRRHLDARELALGDFFRPPAEHPRAVEREGPAVAVAPPPAPEARPQPGADGRIDPAELRRRIEAAYLRASGGERNVRVRLADLRDALADVPRDRLDEALLDMAVRGAAALYRLDNPLEIHGRDREAVLMTPAGDPRHIIYLGGRGS